MLARLTEGLLSEYSLERIFCRTQKMAFVKFAVFFLTRKYTHPKHFELTYLRGPTESFEITRLNPEINFFAEYAAKICGHILYRMLFKILKSTGPALCIHCRY